MSTLRAPAQRTPARPRRFARPLATTLCAAGLAGLLTPTWAGSARAGDAVERLEDEGWGEPPADPFERANRLMFDFNLWLDDWALRPIADGYSFVVPRGARQALDRFYDNLRMPQRFANSLLQAKPLGAGRELARLVTNSTLGIGGLFDPASRLGIAPSAEDFGQTLGVWGLPPGPYLMAPWFGPFTVRDATGAVVDVTLDPVFYAVGGAIIIAVRAGATVSERINDRSLDPELFENLERFSLDPYISVQDFYLQKRELGIAE